MVQPLRDVEIDMVAGIEAQGYIFAAPIADRLRAGFVPLRKPGKLPRATISARYELEYASGQLEMHRDDITPGQRVVVIDDVVATGGTMEAALTMIKQAGGVPVAAGCLVELMGLEGRSKIEACGAELVAVLPVRYRP
jgi:adenine phosphoribosyltransferase